jgi:5-oxoprolinase (ATP-hydrolysing)
MPGANITINRPGGGGWGTPEEEEQSTRGVASQMSSSPAANGFHPRGSVHAFTAMAEAAL